MDDQVSMYFAARKSGYPLERQLAWLESACVAVTNYGSTQDHSRQKAVLYEQAAELTETGLRNQQFWAQKNREEEVADLRFYEASAQISLGDLDAAARTIESADRSLRKAEVLRPEGNDIRKIRVALWAESSKIAEKLKDNRTRDELLSGCWAHMRATDHHASYIFRLLVDRESESDLLGVMWPQDNSGGFQKDSACEDFSPANDVLARCKNGITRLGWRLLQFQGGAELLREANNDGFFTTVLKFGRLAKSIQLDEDSKGILFGFLDEAEKYYSAEGASNRRQRECIGLLVDLDPSRADLMKERLDKLDLEDEILKERDASIAEIIENSGRQEGLLLDSTFLHRHAGANADEHIDECVEVASDAEVLLAEGRREEAASLLGKYVTRFQSEPVLFAELRLFHLWLLALNGNETADYREKVRQFEASIHTFLVQHFPNASGERLEQLATALKQRLTELDVRIGSEAAP